MLDILYDIIVTPLVYIVELSFSILYRVLNNPGLALIGVSLVVNFLCLPLYRMADLAQEAERDKQKSMEKWVNHIKEHFKGDEQYMMLTTYYRQQNYKPASALNGSVSLLLQIPIFMAAYNYLSNLMLLKGESFLFLSDLGAPDQMFTVNGFVINVMPIAMTLLNCVSTFIYTRDLALRDKLQAYGLAAVFLVLLYNSPSGLVLYWTCNQIFSLTKNIFFKVLKHPQEVLCVLAQIALAAFGGYLFMSGRMGSLRRTVALGLIVAIIEFIVISPLVKRRMHSEEGEQREEQKAKASTFLLAGVLITALVGVLIPSALIADSPAEFIDVYNFVSPLGHIVHSACVAGGLFILWVGAYYYLSNNSGKNAIALGMVILAGIFVLDYFVFPDTLGTISTDLVFDEEPVFAREAILKNASAIAALVAALVILWHFKRSLVTPIVGIVAIAIIGLSVPNISAISEVTAEKEQEAIAIANSDELRMFDEDGNPLPIFTLSTEGRNVVVIFMDRAVSGYIPYLFAERPDLAERFDGFTYYPNTLSYGPRTVFGAPALYGGYDYTLEAIDARDDMSLEEKHMESLAVMPRIFSENGFETTVFDPPLVDYEFNVTDYSSLQEMIPDTTIVHTVGAYNDLYLTGGTTTEVLKSNNDRSYFFYGLFRAVPTALRHMVYDDGQYFSTTVEEAPEITLGPVEAHNLANASDETRTPTYNLNSEFFSNYTVLATLKYMTGIAQDDSDNYLIMQNSTTHTPILLQLPDYVPSVYLDNTGLEDYSRFTYGGREVDMSTDWLLSHYHSNMATMLLLADWFDYMREMGVYDNTRIIIVSDHGYELHQWEDMIYDDSLDIEMVNPLLMVKDFDAHGFTTSEEFMTNGDVPTIALDGIVEDPVNPYTGNPINSDEKNDEPQVITTSVRWNVREYQTGNTFNTEDGHTYSVHDNIFDFDNWERLD